LLAAGLVWAFSSVLESRALVRIPAVLLVAVPFVAFIVYATLEKVPVKTVRGGSWIHRNELQTLSVTLNTSDSVAEARTEIQRLFGELPARFSNTLAGGRVREEDSPGNYTIAETNGLAHFIGYDAAGAPHTLTSVSTTNSGRQNVLP